MEGRLRLPARHAGELERDAKPGPCGQGSRPGSPPLRGSFGKGSAAAERAFRNCGLEQGPVRGGSKQGIRGKWTRRKWDGGGGRFNARSQRVSNGQSAIPRPFLREAARRAQRGRAGCAGWGGERRQGPGRGSRLQAKGPGRPQGGRLTPAAQRLHGEDAPPAQHGPNPGPDKAPRPWPLQPDGAIPAGVPAPLSGARPDLARRGPRTLPAGMGEGRREGCAGVRALREGPRGRGLVPPQPAPPPVPAGRGPRSAVLRAPGGPARPAPDVERGALPGDAVWFVARGHPALGFQAGSVFLPPK